MLRRNLFRFCSTVTASTSISQQQLQEQQPTRRIRPLETLKFANSQKRPPSFFRRFWRAFFLFGLATGAAFGISFDLSNDRVLTRSARCVASGALIMYMYKFESPETPEEISRMNQRAATALLDCCLLNEGLYIKLGQQIHSLNAILPKEYSTTLRRLLDSGPPVPVSEVQRIIQEDLGESVDELFVEWDAKPIASASIAQVHKAKFKSKIDGGDEERIYEVAVKVQKPKIRNQMWWDLQCYFLFCWALHTGFGLPVWWSAQHIAEKLTMEIDFTKEADHIDYARLCLLGEDADGGGDGGGENENSLLPRKKSITGEEAGDVYVPRVFREALSKRVLVTEWIESNKLHEREEVEAKFDVPAVMETLVRSYADLIFEKGFIHADPHPANVLVRQHPATAAAAAATAAAAKNDNNNINKNISSSSSTNEKQKHQVVFIDWGLSTKESEKFRIEYAQLFTAVFMRDEECLNRIVNSWGISDSQLFVSLLMQKPVSLDKSSAPTHTQNTSREEVLKMQRRMKDKVASLLEDESKTPKELILLGRGMNLIRSINKSFGAPVNRVNILAERAARVSMSFFANSGNYYFAELRFNFHLWWLSVVFQALQWYAAFVAMISSVFSSERAEGVKNMEDLIDEAERQAVKEMTGQDVEVQEVVEM